MPETVTLAVVAPDYHGDFDPSIEGVDPITRIGTPVPADQVKAIRAAAKANGVEVRPVR